MQEHVLSHEAGTQRAHQTRGLPPIPHPKPWFFLSFIMSKWFLKVNSSCVTSMQPLQPSTTRPQLGNNFAVQAEAVLHQWLAAGNMLVFEGWDHCFYHTSSISKSPSTLVGMCHLWASHLCQQWGWHKGGGPSSSGTARQPPASSQLWFPNPPASAAPNQAQSMPPANGSLARSHERSPEWWPSSCWAPLRRWQHPALGLVGGHWAPQRETGLLRGTRGSSEGDGAPQRDTRLLRGTAGSSEGHGVHGALQRDTGLLWGTRGTQETPPPPWRGGTVVDPGTPRRAEGTRWSPPAPCKSPRSCPRSLGEPERAVTGQSRSLPPAPWPHAPGTSPARPPGTGPPDPRPTPGGRGRQPSGRRLRTEPFGE